MKNIKVSIIVPVYNVEEYLPKCLDSLINQTLKDIEIICINDGTQDNSVEILEKYAAQDKRIKIIHQENQGVSAARNNGMKIATGEYVGFVDSDDWVDLDFFEKLYNAAKKFNSDIAAGDTIKSYKSKTRKLFKYSEEQLFTEAELKLKEAKIPKLNYVWNKIYKREKILNYLFPVGFYYEDIGWSMKAIYDLDGFVIVPNTFYHYEERQNSIVKQKSKKHLDDYEMMVKNCLDFIKEKNIKVFFYIKYFDKEYKLKILGITVIKKEYFYPNIETTKLFNIKIKTRLLDKPIEDKI